ncbi:MAG: M48 family metallopeptidase [Hyphomicrobiales bacterium]|nr:M48 family metallopeptidase [Hyphomicrobiales bacterium]MBV9112386.1 M48 family metallopeptidase [Hyphomicrobiales bacterium]MBV9519370.1 M48 family metallopeptidase [Hyphomicrobiales bacterium]
MGTIRQFRSPGAPGFIDIAHDGVTYRVVVTRSSRARRITLRIRAGTSDPVLTLPARGNLAVAADFAARHAGWLATRLARLPAQIPFRAGKTLPIRGMDHHIIETGALRGLVRAKRIGEVRILEVPGSPEHVSRRVTEFLKREARGDLETAVARHLTAARAQVRRISIKDTKSRWGSCSANGTLSFSWRLILAPSFVLDYLAAHEVAHLRELNHSHKFWRLTRALCPRTDEAEAWMKRYGAQLHRYG